METRKGINRSSTELEELNELITPLIRSGQPLGHIYAYHEKEIVCSRTLSSARAIELCVSDKRDALLHPESKFIYILSHWPVKFNKEYNQWGRIKRQPENIKNKKRRC